MTVGFGMSIGTVNSVWAATVGDVDLPLVRVRRTAVTFDSAGDARIGGLPRFAPVVTDFADLTREIEPVVVGGRIWASADLVAAVATCLIGPAESGGEPVIAYPACYSDSQVATLRHALDWAGATGTLLMPEPVAAVEWLDTEYGVSDNGLTLVYDLGGNSLDIAVVRTEADREKRGVLGKPLRSYEYGGRPLGATLARYARALSPGAASPVSKVIPADDTTRLRTWNIRNSLRLVRRCVRAAGLTIGDVDRILLVGGAARPIEVAQVIAELGRPVVISPDPAHTVAAGAALASLRMADTGGNLGRYARGAAVLSSAAVASALAMSAATMLGGGPIGSDGPVLEFAPVLAGPAPDPARAVQVIDGIDPGAGAMGSPVVADVALSTYSRVQAYNAVTQPVSVSTMGEVQRSLSEHGPGTHCSPMDRLRPPTYADPARFINPMPFANGPATTIPAISLPNPGTGAGNGAPHHVPGHHPLPPTWDPTARVAPPAVSNTSLTNPGATPPVAGPWVGTGLPGGNSAAGTQNSSPATNPGTNTQPGSSAPGTVFSGPATNPGSAQGDTPSSTGTSTGGAASSGNQTSPNPAAGDQTSTGPANGNGTSTGPAIGNGTSTGPASGNGTSTGPASGNGTSTGPASGNGTSTGPASGNGTSTGPAGGNQTSTGPSNGNQTSSNTGGSATSPSSGNGLSSSPGSGTSQNASNSFGGSTSHSMGGDTSSSPGGSTSHNSFGGATSNGTSHSSGGSTSNGTSSSTGGATSHGTSSSAGGSSAGGSSHGGSSSGGSHSGGGGGHR